MKKIFLFAVVLLLALEVGCSDDGADDELVDNAFNNLKNADSYEATMHMDTELKEPLEASMETEMNMLYEKVDDSCRMYTEIKDFQPNYNGYAAYEVMIEGTDVEVKIDDMLDSAGKEFAKLKKEFEKQEAEKKMEQYGIRYYEEMILEARKSYERVNDAKGYEEYETYLIVVDMQELLDYKSEFLMYMAEKNHWGNCEFKIEDVEVYAVINPVNELIKRIEWRMTESIMDRSGHDRKTEAEYDAEIEYYKYNEPINFPDGKYCEQRGI